MLEDWAKLCELLQCSIGARAFVCIHDDRVAAGFLHGHGSDLRIEFAAAGGIGGSVVAHQGELVLVFAADFPARLDVLGSDAHVVAVDWACEAFDECVTHGNTADLVAIESGGIIEEVG